MCIQIQPVKSCREIKPKIYEINYIPGFKMFTTSSTNFLTAKPFTE